MESLALVLAHGMGYALIVQSPVIFTGTYYGASHFQNTLMICLIILQVHCGCVLFNTYMNRIVANPLQTCCFEFTIFTWKMDMCSNSYLSIVDVSLFYYSSLLINR